MACGEDLVKQFGVTDRRVARIDRATLPAKEKKSPKDPSLFYSFHFLLLVSNCPHSTGSCKYHTHNGSSRQISLENSSGS